MSISRRVSLPAAVCAAVLLLSTGVAAAATWSTVPTPNVGSGRNILSAVDVRSATDAWAVGLADHGTSPWVRPLAARWNGSSWSLVSTPGLATDGQFNGVDGSASNNVWAVGGVGTSPLAERWTGSAWSTSAVSLPAGATSGFLQSVKTFSATSAFAVGEHGAATSPFKRTLITRWNGTSWSVLPSPNPDPTQNLLFAVDGVSASDLWAIGGVGHDGYGGDPVGPLVLRWNGSTWTQVAIPPASQFSTTRLQDVVAVSANDVWIVGTAFDRTAFRQVPYTLHWNGSSWQHGTLPGSPAGRFDGVTALSATKVYAVGTMIARWNGSSWVQESGTPPGLLLAAEALAPATVWTVGMTYNGSNIQTLAMRTTNG